MQRNSNIFHRILGKVFRKFRPYYSYFDYYENQLEQFSLKGLLTTFSERNINDINSNSEISFFSFPFFSELKQITKKLGTPRYQMKHPKIENFTSAFFRKKVGHSKVTIMFLFFENKLIYGRYIFDHFNTNSYKEIEKLLWQKYVAVPKITSTITDTGFNRIEFQYDVENKINFVCGDPSIAAVLTDLLRKEEQQLLAKTQIAFSEFI